MTAAIKDIIIEQKSTFKQRITWKDKNGAAINLTGYSARMQIKNPDGVVVVDLSNQNNKIKLGGVTGTIDLLLSVAETTVLQPTPLLYDLKLIEPDGTAHRKMQGNIIISVGQTV